MKLTPPTFGVWLIALLLGGGGIAEVRLRAGAGSACVLAGGRRLRPAGGGNALQQALSTTGYAPDVDHRESVRELIAALLGF